MAGAASLDPVLHGAALTEEGVRAVDALLGALEEFVGGVGNGADRLVGTGVVWSAADRVVELRALGQTGVVAKAVETCAEMVGDAFTELKEWVESEDLDGSDSEGDGEDAEQEFWDRPTRKGRLDEVTKEAAEGALKKLKLVTILFGAARKRRLVGEGALGVVGRVDAIAVAAKEVSAVADDLGVAYFEEEELEDAVRTLGCGGGGVADGLRDRILRSRGCARRRPRWLGCACWIAGGRRMATRRGLRTARRRWRNLHDTTTTTATRL